MAEVEHIKPYSSDKRAKPEQVRDMFDAIAPAYDFMNRAMTMGIDRLWLRRLVDTVAAVSPSRIIDMATGTGDVAIALAQRLPSAMVIGLDLSEGMLAKARRRAMTADIGGRVEFMQCDCLSTELPNGWADAVTVAYGVRNFADISAGLGEMYRLLRPGGILAILELSTPVNAVVKSLYRFYTGYIIPFVGRLISGDSDAYSYLPRSIAAAPQRQQMAKLMTQAGFVDASFRSLTFGVCTLYTARRP